MEEFFAAFKASKTFALMDDTQRTAVMTAYSRADDVLLRNALKELQETEAVIRQNEKQYHDGQNAKAESAQSLRDSYHQFQRVDREESEAVEHNESEKEAQKLLKQAEKIQPNTTKKKHWGIF